MFQHQLEMHLHYKKIISLRADSWPKILQRIRAALELDRFGRSLSFLVDNTIVVTALQELNNLIPQFGHIKEFQDLYVQILNEFFLSLQGESLEDRLAYCLQISQFPGREEVYAETLLEFSRKCSSETKYNDAVAFIGRIPAAKHTVPTLTEYVLAAVALHQKKQPIPEYPQITTCLQTRMDKDFMAALLLDLWFARKNEQGNIRRYWFADYAGKWGGFHAQSNLKFVTGYKNLSSSVIEARGALAETLQALGIATDKLQITKEDIEQVLLHRRHQWALELSASRLEDTVSSQTEKKDKEVTKEDQKKLMAFLFSIPRNGGWLPSNALQATLEFLKEHENIQAKLGPSFKKLEELSDSIGFEDCIFASYVHDIKLGLDCSTVEWSYASSFAYHYQQKLRDLEVGTYLFKPYDYRGDYKTVPGGSHPKEIVPTTYGHAMILAFRKDAQAPDARYFIGLIDTSGANPARKAPNTRYPTVYAKEGISGAWLAGIEGRDWLTNMIEIQFTDPGVLGSLYGCIDKLPGHRIKPPKHWQQQGQKAGMGSCTLKCLEATLNFLLPNKSDYKELKHLWRLFAIKKSQQWDSEDMQALRLKIKKKLEKKFGSISEDPSVSAYTGKQIQELLTALEASPKHVKV